MTFQGQFSREFGYVRVTTGSLILRDVSMIGGADGPVYFDVFGPGDVRVENLVARDLFNGLNFELGNQGEVSLRRMPLQQC